MGKRPFFSTVDILRIDTTMSHNGKYPSKSLARNTVKQKNIIGLLKRKMAEGNEDETKTAVGEREF